MNWKSIIATGLITGLVTIGTGVFLFWYQTKAPHLTYNFIKSIPFKDTSNQVFIQQFEIVNSGNETAENISLIIKFPHAEIEKFNVDINNGIKYSKVLDKSSITISLDNLNPEEKFSLSILLKAKVSLFDTPIISLRAKGIKGEKIGNEQRINDKFMIGIALIAAYAGILAFILSNTKSRELFLEILSAIISGHRVSRRDQKYVIASILSMYGFPEKAKEYLNFSNNRQYWVEADLIGAEAIEADESTKRKTLKVLFHFIDIDKIVASSKAIIYYNIARVKKSLNDDYLDELDKAKEIDKKEIEQRLSKDPMFNNT